jgi:exodeoxyribonuclease VII large subunit
MCDRLERLSTNLEHLMRFKIVSARARVQEHALSQVFDEVRAKLRDARLHTARTSHELQAAMNLTLLTARRRADAVRQQLAPANLLAHVSGARSRFEAASSGCNEAMNTRLQDARRRLSMAAASLDALSPLAVLQRGYAIAQNSEGRLLRDSEGVTIGDAVNLRLAQGRLHCRVEGKSDE